jgi:hypothetical protein
LVCALALAGTVGVANAAVSYSTAGGTYAQDFDSLTSSTSSTTWTNNSTLPGWSLFGHTGVAIATYLGGTGSSNTGSIFSFGTNADRALGGVGSGNAYWGGTGPASGAIAGWWSVAITNDTGASLSEFTVGFDGEQWRNGNTSAQTMVLEYGFGATFGAVASWTAPGGAFDFTSPSFGGTAAALDGNLPANRTADLGGTISNLNWGVGDTLWIRWVERNDAGSDHGLAVDNFSFSAVPAPGSIALFGMGALVAGRRRR